MPRKILITAGSEKSRSYFNALASASSGKQTALPIAPLGVKEAAERHLQSKGINPLTDTAKRVQQEYTRATDHYARCLESLEKASIKKLSGNRFEIKLSRKMPQQELDMLKLLSKTTSRQGNAHIEAASKVVNNHISDPYDHS